MIKLNKNQKNLIVGTLLGDAQLKTETNGRTWKYRVIDKAIDNEYLMHKFNILINFCETKPIYEEVFDKRTNKNYNRFYFNTLIDDSFRFYANLFYENEDCSFIKIIPKNIEKWLNAEVLAYWYMDYRSLKSLDLSNGIIFSTENFSYICVKRLQKAILYKFNINSTLIKVKKKSIIIGYRLYINEANCILFRDLIKPYLLNSMI